MWFLKLLNNLINLWWFISVIMVTVGLVFLIRVLLHMWRYPYEVTTTLDWYSFVYT